MRVAVANGSACAEHLLEQHVVCLSVLRSMMGFFFCGALAVFYLLLSVPPLLTPFPLLTQCDGSLDVSVWGLMAGLRGLLAMGALLPSRGRLVTVEAPGLPRHLLSIQLKLDVVVNWAFLSVYTVTG